MALHSSVMPTPRRTFSENFFALFFIDASVNVTEARRIASGNDMPLCNIRAISLVNRISRKEWRIRLIPGKRISRDRMLARCSNINLPPATHMQERAIAWFSNRLETESSICRRVVSFTPSDRYRSAKEGTSFTLKKMNVRKANVSKKPG